VVVRVMKLEDAKTGELWKSVWRFLKKLKIE
jgi:hypothetical protein